MTTTAPAGELERRLAALWSEILQIRQVGVDDGFVELGGTSLQATRLLSRVREQLGVHVSVKEFFAARTVRGLAERIRTAPASAHTLPPVVPAGDRAESYPPSLGQQRLWFLTQLHPAASVAYNVPAALRLRGPLDAAALRDSLADVVARHDVLRTGFELRPDGLMAIVREEAEVGLRVVDVTDDRLQAAARTEAAQPFDLARLPLLRATLFRVAPDDHLLLVVLHHMVSDGWSVDILDAELAAGYAAKVGGSAADLPADRPRPPVPSHRGRRTSRPLPRHLDDAVRRLAMCANATPFAVYLTAFGLLLHELTGRDDLLVGTPAAGRLGANTEHVFGFFVNTVVLRLRRDGNPTFRAALDATTRVAFEAFEHQHLPFERLVREHVTDRDPSVTPLVQVVFAYQGPRRPNARLAGLDATPVPIDNGTAKFDLILEIEELADGPVITAEYRTDLFEAESIERLLDAYVDVLGSGVEQPERTVHRGGDCLHELFERAAARHGDQIAVTDQDRSLSYDELNRAANRLAHRLRLLGVGPDVLVGVCVPRGVDLVIALLAVVKAGGGYVPLDPTHPPARRRFVLTDAGCPVVVGHERLRDELATPTATFVSMDADRSLADEPEANPTPVNGAGDVAYVIYTSGSTGQPKGVMVSHANVTRLFDVTAAPFGFDGEDVWTLFHSAAFDFSVWEMWGALLHGGRLVVVPYATSRDPAAFLRLLIDERITVLNQTPSAFRQLLGAARDAGFPGTSLRLVIFGGEALQPASLRPWFDHYGDDAPLLVNMYGITETTVHVTQRVMTTADARLPASAGSPIGRPLADLRAHVLDEHLAPVPPGAKGELYVGGAGCSRGYLGRPELTAERFVPDPFGPPGGRLYRSGDLVIERADGELLYVGRADAQVQLRGFRIELGEVESALLSLPAIRDAAVVLRDDRLVAYLVPNSREAPTGPALREALGERLPDYMVPSTFVTLDVLPLTANGKLDRDALGGGQPLSEAPVHVAPRTPTERRLADIWADVLGTERVGAHDNFFALGGDSILAIRLVVAANAAGLPLDVQTLFRWPTVAELAAELSTPDESARPDGDVPMPPVELPDRVVDAYPVSAMQLGLIYECLVSADPTLYHDLTSVRLRGPLDTAALRRALDLVSTRHEALRTSFDMVNFAEPTQLVHRHAPIPVVVEQAAEGTEPQTALRQWWTAQWRRPFERDRPPLVRCHVLVHPDQTFHLSLSVHHAVLDGWSFAVLVAELIRAYDQELGGADAALPALPATRFRDFVALERQAVYSEQTRRFWRRIGDLRRAPLPRRSTDGPTSPGVDPDVHRTLPAPLAAAVRRVAADLAVPPKSVYLTAHLWALGALCGAPHAVSGVVTNGRQEAEGADRVLGLFLNVLPLGVELAGGSWTDLIREVFASERECLPYRRYPLAQITEDIGETPCEAVFNYTDLYAFDAIGELTRLDVVDWWFCDRTSFPLVLEVNHQPSTGAAELSIRLDHGELAPEVAGRMAELFTGALTLISDDVKAPYPPPG